MLVASSLSSSASSTSKMWLRLRLAALLTTRSIVPNAASVASMIVTTPAVSLWSAGTPITSAPYPSISALVASTASGVRLLITTFMPSLASLRAMPLPMPRLEPVTIATLPLSSGYRAGILL